MYVFAYKAMRKKLTAYGKSKNSIIWVLIYFELVGKIQFWLLYNETGFVV